MSGRDGTTSARTASSTNGDSGAAAHGTPFPLRETTAYDAIAELGRYTMVTVDPPWTSVADALPRPDRLVYAADMEVVTLDSVVAGETWGGSVVGLGGGTAIDTAKYIAWRRDKALIQIPSIASVDAAFTDAIGVRVDGHVRYRGSVVPDLVVLDLPLVATAPARLNRAGIGDILSCHTAMYDWHVASEADEGVAWSDDLAVLGRGVLGDLSEAADDIQQVTDAGIRFLVETYRTIGAACTAVGHSRVEEGAEHFLAYAYEFLSGDRQIHGELVALCTAGVAYLQDNQPARVVDVISRCGTTANPADLGIVKDLFVEALTSARSYAIRESLDFSILNVIDITPDRAAEVWEFLSANLPRVP